MRLIRDKQNGALYLPVTSLASIAPPGVQPAICVSLEEGEGGVLLHRGQRTTIPRDSVEEIDAPVSSIAFH